MWYRNTIPSLRQTVLGLVSPWSDPPHQIGHLPCCDHRVNSCPMNTSNEALWLLYPRSPLLVVAEPLLLAGPRLLLGYQEGVLPSEGAIWGDEECHLHQQCCLVVWHIGEQLTNAPVSCLCGHCQEMVSQPGRHSHLGGRRWRSLHCHCCHWLGWWWCRGARPSQLWQAALVLPGQQLHGRPLTTCRVSRHRTTAVGAAGHCSRFG